MNSDATVTPTPRRDVTALELIIEESPEVFVDIVGQPNIGIPIRAGAKRVPWPLRHQRVRAEVAGFIWEKTTTVPYDHELNRILQVLESLAWADQRLDVDLKDAIDHDPLLECLLIFLRDPDRSGGINSTASALLNALSKAARKIGIDTKHHAWPKGAAQLSRRIGELSSLLKKAGITVERGRNSGGIRFINLSQNVSCDDSEPTASRSPSIDKSHHPRSLSTTANSDDATEDIYLAISVEPERE